MVLVSAVANPSRLVTVHNSLQRFAPSSWDCKVCTWNNDVHELLQRASSASDKLNAGRELAGPAVARAARYVARRCAIVYRRNYKWASLLNATRHTGASHEFTFVLLDDIELPRSSFDAERLLDLARRRRLDVLSPLVRGGSHNFMNPSEAFQRQVKEHGTELRLQLVIEAYATLFTSAAWVHWRCEATAAPPHPPQLTAATLQLTCPPVLFGFTMHGELFGQVASVELLNLGRSTTCSLRLPGGSALRRLAPPLPALHGHRPREAGPPHTAAVPRGNPPGAWPRLPARARRSGVRHGGAVLLAGRAN